MLVSPGLIRGLLAPLRWTSRKPLLSDETRSHRDSLIRVLGVGFRFGPTGSAELQRRGRGLPELFCRGSIFLDLRDPISALGSSAVAGHYLLCPQRVSPAAPGKDSLLHGDNAHGSRSGRAASRC